MKANAWSNTLLSLTVTSTLCLVGCASTSETGSSGSVRKSSGYEEVDTDEIEDAVPRHEAKSKYGNPKSYKVFGKTYYVEDSADGFRERGMASWYGHPFHGRRTSSGEPYDMYKMTAAHKTVPIPSYMRVTNLENGKSIIVRVNDRGPFHDGRVIDLSYVAAKKLGVHAKGTLPVEIAVVTPTKDVAPATVKTRTAPPTLIPAPTKINTPAGQQTFLQVAAFSAQANAQQMADNLRRLPNAPGAHIESGYNNFNQPVYRVRVGPFNNSTDAQNYITLVKDMYPDTSPVVVTNL